MKKLFYLIFILLVTTTYSQNYSKSFSNSAAINFLLHDSNILWNKTYPDIINEAKKFGYSIYREEDQFLFDMYLYGVHYKLLILEKEIYDYNYEFFPKYTVGYIFKYYYFQITSKDKLDTESKPQIIETKIKMLEYSNINKKAIDNYFFNLKNYYEKTYVNDFKTKNSEQVYMDKIPSYGETNFGVLTLNNIKTSKTLFSTHPDEYGDPFEVITDVTVSYGNDYEYFKNKNGDTKAYGIFGIKYWSTYLFQNNILYEMSKKTEESINDLKYFINAIDIREISMYDLKSMVNIFLSDCSEFNIKTPNIDTLKATFEPLDGNTIALAYGMNYDDVIVIKVDPIKWQEATDAKKWYILYHELGHDVLNLEHGEGGKMMFNYSESEYTWEDFFIDKEYMFRYYKN